MNALENLIELERLLNDYQAINKIQKGSRANGNLKKKKIKAYLVNQGICLDFYDKKHVLKKVSS